ncbi:MAG TPA: hypothetical protein VF552_08975 [Allosphingosinicella sp.]
MILAAAACSAASAAPLDPESDVHCFALATAYGEAARRMNSPADQQHAIAGVAAWYAPKFDAAAQGRTREDILAETAALERSVDRNPQAGLAALTACTDRAAADPGFNAFAARWARR